MHVHKKIHVALRPTTLTIETSRITTFFVHFIYIHVCIPFVFNLQPIIHQPLNYIQRPQHSNPMRGLHVTSPDTVPFAHMETISCTQGKRSNLFLCKWTFRYNVPTVFVLFHHHNSTTWPPGQRFKSSR